MKRSAVHARNRMPLHLPRSAVDHRGGEDGKHRLRVPEDFVLDDGVMLFHARVERHVVVLRPTTCDDQASLGCEWYKRNPVQVEAMNPSQLFLLEATISSRKTFRSKQCKHHFLQHISSQNFMKFRHSFVKIVANTYTFDGKYRT